MKTTTQTLLVALAVLGLAPALAAAEPAPEVEALKAGAQAPAAEPAKPAEPSTAAAPAPAAEPAAKAEPKAEPKPADVMPFKPVIDPKPEAEPKPAPKPEAPKGTPPPKPTSKVAGKVAVLDFTLAGTAHPDLARVMGDGAARGAAKAPNVQVMSQGEIVALLGLERTKQMLGCDDPSCVTELAHALDSDRLISGSLTILDRTSLITVRLIDAKQARTLSRATATLADATEAELVDNAGRLAHEVLTGEKLDTSGTLRVRVGVPGATVTLDGKSLGETPLQGPQRVLQGPHSVVVQKPGFIRWASTVSVAAGADIPVEVELIPIQLISEKARSRLWSWGFASAGVAVVSAGAGITFGKLADNSYDDYKTATTRSAAVQAHDDTKFRALLANVSWGVAGAATAGAGYLLFSAVREDARAAGDAAKAAEGTKSAGVVPLPGGASFVFGGTF
jgi:hypothetical protein